MRVKVELEIKNCQSCPFKEHIYEQGLCGDFCGYSKRPYDAIAKTGINKHCPLRQFEIKSEDLQEKEV